MLTTDNQERGAEDDDLETLTQTTRSTEKNTPDGMKHGAETMRGDDATRDGTIDSSDRPSPRSIYRLLFWFAMSRQLVSLF